MISEDEQRINLRQGETLEALLVARWATIPKSFWRGGAVDYAERYKRISEYLNKEVHPHTTEGAFAAQLQRIEGAVKDGKDGDELLSIVVKNTSWLTDHGPDHIRTVIRHASELVRTSQCTLSSYEVFILLASIHFHDVGNIFGRDEHEKKITEVMTRMDESVIGGDASEKRMIRSIATAHGGTVNGDMDTIRHLPFERIIKAQKIRPHLLAGILRFADELADDYTRASRFALLQGNMLEASQVFHRYADRLREVNISEGNVEIRFELSREVATATYGKGNEKVFLLDEIFARTLKLYQEHIYCMRYMRPEIKINSVSIRIGIFENGYMDEIRSFDFKLEEQGYPQTSLEIHDLCPDLKGADGLKVTGAVLSEELKGSPN